MRWSTWLVPVTRHARGVLATVAVALAAAFAGAAGGAVSAASAATNLISNGTFEGSGAGSLTGWGGSSGSLSLVAGNGGGHAAKLTATSGASSTYAYTTSKPVKSAVAGTAYQLSGDVQSSAGRPVGVPRAEGAQVRHDDHRRKRAELPVPTSAWQTIPAVNYTVKTTGDSLTVNVLEKPAVSGANFAIDNIVLATGSSGGGGGGDTQAPSVPQGVTADREQRHLGHRVVAPRRPTTWASPATTSTATDRSWRRSAARRPPSPMARLQPSTTYSYTVDAFDAVPNTSTHVVAARNRDHARRRRRRWRRERPRRADRHHHDGEQALHATSSAARPRPTSSR